MLQYYSSCIPNNDPIFEMGNYHHLIHLGEAEAIIAKAQARATGITKVAGALEVKVRHQDMMGNCCHSDMVYEK